MEYQEGNELLIKKTVGGRKMTSRLLHSLDYRAPFNKSDIQTLSVLAPMQTFCLESVFFFIFAIHALWFTQPGRKAAGQ